MSPHRTPQLPDRFPAHLRERPSRLRLKRGLKREFRKYQHKITRLDHTSTWSVILIDRSPVFSTLFIEFNSASSQSLSGLLFKFRV